VNGSNGRTRVDRRGHILARPTLRRRVFPAPGVLATLLAVTAVLALAPASASAKVTPEPLWTRCAAESEADLLCRIPRGIATSPDGAVYIADSNGGRVLAFNAWGEFLRAFGGGVVVGEAKGTGDLNETTTVSGVTTSKGAFEAGRTLTGEGIAPGTKITALGPGTITLSQAATETKAGAQIEVAAGAGNMPLNELQRIELSADAQGSFQLTFTTPEPSPSSATTGSIPAGATASQVEAALKGLANIGTGNVSVSGPAGGPWAVEFEGERFADTNVAQLSSSSTHLEAILGETELHCSVSFNSLSEADTYSYQWLRNGVPITGATSTTYMPSASSTTTPATTTGDAGGAIQCQVFGFDAPSPSNLDGAGSTQISNPAVVVAPAPATLPPTAPASFSVGPSGLGLVSAGDTLSCPTSGWGGSPTSFAFRWYRNGVVIAGATSSTYAVTNANVEHRAAFQCSVSAANAGGTVVKASRNQVTEPEPNPPAPGGNGGSPDVRAPLAAEVATTRIGASAAETCTALAQCKGGVAGKGGGQFGVAVGAFAIDSVQGIAVDSAGDVFVVDRPNHRVEKLDPEGHFLLTWGKGVNKTAIDEARSGEEGICPAPGHPADVCQAGEEGAASGQFGAWTELGSYIAVDTHGTESAADDDVYVGDAGRIQRCDVEGEGCVALPDPEGLLSAKKVSGLAVVPTGSGTGDEGDLFLAREGTAGLLELDGASGAKQCEATLGGQRPTAIAADSAGDAYAALQASGSPVHKLSPACAEIEEEKTSSPFFPTFPFTPGFAESTGIAVGEACWSAPDYGLYLANSVNNNASVRAYGPSPEDLGPENCRPAKMAPGIESQGAISVETSQAIVQATINPEAQADTTYFVQYATAACVPASEAEDWEAACAQQTSPAPLGGGAVSGVKTKGVQLTNLTPATSYRFRFAAESSGGGPVYGVGGTEAVDGSASSFTTTTPPSGPETDCPNQALRYGASALLPDCRAYEMVSPIDKNGADINTETGQASPEGERLAYANGFEPVFAGQPSSKVIDSYLATRGPGGWTDRGVNAPLGRQLQAGGEISYPSAETQLFSADLCSDWITDYNFTPLTLDAQQGFANLYRQDLCGEGGFEALSTVTPPSGTGPGYVGNQSVQGISADGSQTFFVASAGLTPEAAPGAQTNTQIYVHSASGLHLVSVLPGGSADPGSGTEGAQLGGGFEDASHGNLERAVSADGSRVYWTSRAIAGGGLLYLRTHPEQGVVSGECSKPSKPCTVAVGSGSTRTFWTATPDGEEALYSEGPLSTSGEGQATLYRFTAATEAHTQIAKHVRGVLGASEDLSRVYFISTDPLTGASENEAGQKAEAGKPNLYLDDEGTITFIAVLSDTDQQGSVYRLGSVDPLYNAARVTPDGSRLAFLSRAPLTGFDNTDAASGEADAELFLYEAGGVLRCVSCAASGELPHGGELPDALILARESPPTGVWGAAWITGTKNRLDTSNVLSTDGKRLFFTSLTRLLARDTNGVKDVYEWEAPGAGRCSTEAPAFHAANGGCLYLISSGESPAESLFFDASADGRDVFFTTASGLLPQDPGLVDLYDARVEGGFPQPTEAAACEGEACQSPPAAPDDPTPASSSFQGAGNVVEEPVQPKPCPKAKVGRKGKCVPKHHKRTHHRAAHKNRRTHR
jgi:hypothetical protein